MESKASFIRLGAKVGEFDRVDIRRGVEKVITDAGILDLSCFGRDSVVPPKVFFLVNHVMHRRSDESEVDFRSKVTDSEVIKAVVEVVMGRLGNQGSSSIGNAPLQGCDYERVTRDSGIREVLSGWSLEERPELVDLRGLVSKWSRFGTKISDHRRPSEDGVEVDLARYSLLEPLYEKASPPRFRVGDYSGLETDGYHGPGRHVYVVNRRLLASNLIVSVPKLKTHQKVGLTGALKGTVGSIYLKQCLAHHRLGSPSSGGDEFSTDGSLERLASRFSNFTAGLGSGHFENVERIGSKVAYRLIQKRPGIFGGGAWSGNDTAWRMSLDIARVLRFARPDGSLADTPQRLHIAIIDGLLAGEGEGPLRPSARREGVLIAGTDPAAADVMAALAMGWNPASLNLLEGAFDLTSYPITDTKSFNDVRLFVEGKYSDFQSVSTLCKRPFSPPRGWNIEDLILNER